MTSRVRRGLGAVLVLFGLVEVATMLLGRSILWWVVCGPAPPGTVSDCIVPDVVRVLVLLAVIGAAALAARSS